VGATCKRDAGINPDEGLNQHGEESEEARDCKSAPFTESGHLDRKTRRRLPEQENLQSKASEGLEGIFQRAASCAADAAAGV
jgi:hypothetical protein